MKTVILSIISILATFSDPSSAALGINPGDVITALSKENTSVGFNAINHVIISPTSGNISITGFGTIDSPIDTVELTYSYDIAGTIIKSDGIRSEFIHGTEIDGISNQLRLYVENKNDHSSADENNAATFTDGIKIATMDVLPLKNETGFFDISTGQGADQITFKLSDNDKAQYGIVDNDLFFKISSQILLVDIASDVPPQAFNFGAFDNACGPLENPFNSCSRELGQVKVTMAHTPIPGSLGLFLSGFGLYSLMLKRKQIKNT